MDIINKKFVIFDDRTLFGFADTIEEAHQKINKFYYNTLWEQFPSTIEVFVLVTESNGYQHCGNKAVFTASSKEFWGGKYGKN